MCFIQCYKCNFKFQSILSNWIPIQLIQARKLVSKLSRRAKIECYFDRRNLKCFGESEELKLNLGAQKICLDESLFPTNS